MKVHWYGPDSTSQLTFKKLPLVKSGYSIKKNIHYGLKYLKISEKAMRLLFPLCSTLWAYIFKNILQLKQCHKRLNGETDRKSICLLLPQTLKRFTKQCHTSHQIFLRKNIIIFHKNIRLILTFNRLIITLKWNDTYFLFAQF